MRKQDWGGDILQSLVAEALLYLAGMIHSTLCVENSHNKWYHKPSILGHFIIFIEES